MTEVEVTVTASNKFSWERAIAESDLPATSRHVAFTLGLYFSKAGDSCWPSMDTLARASGLDRSTVVRHIALLRRAGWLTVTSGGSKRGEKRVSNRYETAVPADQLPFDTGRTKQPVAENDQSHTTTRLGAQNNTTRRTERPYQSVPTTDQDEPALSLDESAAQVAKIKRETMNR